MMNVFGKALMAYYRGEKEPIKIHRDDGFVSEQNVSDYFSEYDEWPRYEKEALRFVKGKVLDIGCGAGRHSLWLQSRGFSVTAIDISPLAVEVARLRGVKDCRVISAIELQFTSETFDTLLLMGNNFGIAGNVENTKKLFEKFRKITSKDALVITTCRDPAKTDKPEHLHYHDLNRKRGRPIGQVTLRIEYKSEFGEWFDLLMVSQQEMASICRLAGWQTEKFVQENAAYAAVLKRMGGLAKWTC